MVVLEVKNVKKSFRLPVEQASGIKQAFVNWAKGIKGYREQKVLKDISFTVEKGDFLGIVGRNGSGKSTLLKIISQIYTPDSGEVKVNGKLVPFIELGVGFNPELTGRENIYLNGALLGFSHEEVNQMYDEIVDFAELHDFMDQKLKNYSSGMQVRLAFSIAIKAQGDILVLDEVLAVGDEAFQRKCDNFFSDIKNDKSKTVILVTHSMEAVKKYCNKAILIKDGEVVASGDKYDVANKYTEENLRGSSKESTGKYKLRVYPDKSNHNIVESKDGFKFNISYDYKDEKDLYLAFGVVDLKRGGSVYDSGSQKVKKGKQTLKFDMPLDLFNSGEFKIMAVLRNGDNRNSSDAPIEMTGNSTSCVFLIENKNEYSRYALLNKEKFIIKQIK